MNEVRLRFWEQLRLTNPELFNGAPARQHFYNLVHRECLPFRIRLNIYCTRHYYENNGFLTVRVLTAGNQIGNLSRQLAIINQGIIIEPIDFQPPIGYDIICRNFDPAYQIGEDDSNWAMANDWFKKNVSMLVKELKELAKNVSISRQH
ncbi:MAG: hypothetical protein GX125_04600 [Bacteroidales bacterium]|jgi:hypothetical protein|nr:hypothetical protein [Bacteroidales bacterium]